MTTREFCSLSLLLIASVPCCAESGAALFLQNHSGDIFDQAASGQTGTKAAVPSKRRLILSTQELAKRVRNSLVMIVTQDHNGNAIAQGSGFFITPTLVATNLHVLKRASQGYVKSVSEGVVYKITNVAGFSLKRDLCVLFLANAKGMPLPSSTAEVSVGQDILVAGNPEGLEATFSKGIISAIRSREGLLQIDAPISPGSSGGPVVTQSGEVIGLVVSSLTEGQNLNFAVPMRFKNMVSLRCLNSRIDRVTPRRSHSERPGSQVPSRAFWSRGPNLIWERSPESRAATCRRATRVARSV
jgi:S1-C subfamily serine protease